MGEEGKRAASGQAGMDRRGFLKRALQVTGGAAAAAVIPAVATPLVFREEQAFDPNDSYWAEGQPSDRTDATPLAGDLRVDTAIIGGGLTGLFTACELAARFPSRRILVLEARQVGHGASGRNGGMVLTQSHNESFEIDEDGDTHRLVYQATSGAIQRMARLVREEDGDCDLVLDGFLHVVHDPEDMDHYEEYVEKARALGLPLELLDDEETARELGTEAYAGAVYDPSGGQVHPMKLVLLLKQAALARGVVIREHSPVLAIEEGRPVRLAVGEKRVQVTADQVVLATNAYTSKLGYFQNEVLAIHTQTAVTPPLSPALLARTGWGSRLPFFDSRNLLFHLILTPDNRVCIGGGNAEYFFNNGTHYPGSLDPIAELLAGELARLYPALKGVGFERIWNGMIGATWDAQETVGVDGREGNIFHALAYNGSGITLSCLFATILADLFEGKAKAWEKTPFLNHSPPFIPPEPWRWLGTRVAFAWYRHQDGKQG